MVYGYFFNFIRKKGISSMQLSRDISVNKNTAWLLQMKIRNVMSKETVQQLDGIVEVDETFIGGKIKRFSKKKNKTVEDDIT
jgi:hypothetical protein